MIYCNACGGSVSERAVACPICGEPVNRKQTKARWSTPWFAFLMVVTAFIPLVGWVGGGIACYRGETTHGGWLVGFGLLMSVIYINMQ